MTWFDSVEKGPRWSGSTRLFEKFPRSEHELIKDQLCSEYPVWFFEVLAKIEGNPLVLERFQIDYLNDNERFKSTLKTRQAGGSMIVSAAKFWKAMKNEYYRCDIVSSNLKEAKYKIKYVKDFYDSIPDRWKPKLVIDNTYSIGFHGGTRLSEINSLAASAGIRGGKKDIFVDESAIVPKYEEMYTAAVPATIRNGGAFEQVFTPLGQSGRAWEIHTNQKNAKGENPYAFYSRHNFGWWQVTPFCKDIDGAALAWADYDEDFAHMDLLVEEFATDALKTVIGALTTEEFHQEFCCRFVDEGEAYFPWTLLRQCTRPSEDQHSEIDEKLKTTPVQKEYMPLWKERPKEAEEVFIGIDFAEGKAGGDSTSIQVIERMGDGRLRHRSWFDLDYRSGHVGLDAHMAFISNEVIPRFKPDRVRIDATGMGIHVRDVLMSRHGHLIDPVPFSIQSKEEMVTNLKVCLETQKLWISEDNKHLLGQMHGIKRTPTSSGNYTYAGDKHDDMFWALALACKGLGRTPFRIMGIGNRS